MLMIRGKFIRHLWESLSMRSTCLMCHLKSESITLVQIWAADGAIIIGHTVLDVAPKWRG